ncbi:MAG: hypothetical protein JWP69_2037 [Flaviaesturariibacter sp.]|nr:hypothetical protein [Flaviaesturariibacter sp.]
MPLVPFFVKRVKSIFNQYQPPLSFLSKRWLVYPILYSVLPLCFCGCSAIQNAPKDELANGVYASRSGLPFKKVFVSNDEETIVLYPVVRKEGGNRIDTHVHVPVSLTRSLPGSGTHQYSFRQASFDIDFLTIPFKYRPVQQGFPRQFNTTLNGAVLLGYRTDAYKVRYKTDLLERPVRQLTHFGFSFGGFTGLGGTTVNPWVTAYAIDSEYDGVVWTNGLAGIFGVNRLSAGVALGWDRLLDRNKASWLYQKKPWAGLVFGLQLN